MNVNVLPWHLLDTRNVGASLNDAIQTRVAIPIATLFTTFRVVISTFVGGNLTLKLRFGFMNADADVATLGIDFANLGAINLSDVRTVTFTDGAAVAPDTHGSPLYILPPRVTIKATTAIGTNIDYRLFYSGLYLS